MEPLARLVDAIMLPRVSSVAQERSGEVRPAVAIIRLTFAVVVELEPLLPPPLTTPLLLVDHNSLHSRRLLHHLPQRRFAALNATGVP